jgi:hypothetical protein
MKKSRNLSTTLFHANTPPTKTGRTALIGLPGILPGVATTAQAGKTDNSAGAHKRSNGHGLFLTNKVFRI